MWNDPFYTARTNTQRRAEKKAKALQEVAEAVKARRSKVVGAIRGAQQQRQGRFSAIEELIKGQLDGGATTTTRGRGLYPGRPGMPRGGGMPGFPRGAGGPMIGGWEGADMPPPGRGSCGPGFAWDPERGECRMLTGIITPGVTPWRPPTPPPSPTSDIEDILKQKLLERVQAPGISEESLAGMRSREADIVRGREQAERRQALAEYGGRGSYGGRLGTELAEAERAGTRGLLEAERGVSTWAELQRDTASRQNLGQLMGYYSELNAKEARGEQLSLQEKQIKNQLIAMLSELYQSQEIPDYGGLFPPGTVPPETYLPVPKPITIPRNRTTPGIPDMNLY